MDRRIILEAVMGSKAYGLDTPESDEDLRSVFVARTRHVLSLEKPKDTIQKNDPDVVLQEVGKFISLALANNPTVLEMFFIEDYRVLTEEGRLLVDNRDCFLSQRVRKTFGGYAIAQVKRLERRADGTFASDLKGRYAKHARHCFRLIQQGTELLSTGHITVKVSNRDELFAVGELDPVALKERFEEEFAIFDATESTSRSIPTRTAPTSCSCRSGHTIYFVLDTERPCVTLYC